jgi:hypothetical protein
MYIILFNLERRRRKQIYFLLFNVFLLFLFLLKFRGNIKMKDFEEEGGKKINKNPKIK